jgi:hypothetical protein
VRALVVDLMVVGFMALAIASAPVGAQETSGGSQQWPPDPSNVSVACEDQNYTKLITPAVVAVQTGHWADAIALATKGAAQMTDCIEVNVHPKYVLFRAVFESIAADAYFNQSDEADVIRYFRLSQSDLAYVSTYRDRPNDIESVLAAVVNMEKVVAKMAAAGNTPLGTASAQSSNDQVTGNLMTQPNSPNDSHSVMGFECWANAQRPSNAFWSVVAPDVKPETLLGVKFENEASVPLTDLRVHFDFINAFGETIASVDGVWAGSFASGVIIDFGPGHPGILEKPPLADASQVKDVSCYISGARWSDGTVRSFTQ